MRMNLGLLALIALIVCRIFSENFSILVRAVVFLALGVIFLVTNVFLSRCFPQERKPGEGRGS